MRRVSSRAGPLLDQPSAPFGRARLHGLGNDADHASRYGGKIRQGVLREIRTAGALAILVRMRDHGGKAGGGCRSPARQGGPSVPFRVTGGSCFSVGRLSLAGRAVGFAGDPMGLNQREIRPMSGSDLLTLQRMGRYTEAIDGVATRVPGDRGRRWSERCGHHGGAVAAPEGQKPRGGEVETNLVPCGPEVSCRSPR